MKKTVLALCLLAPGATATAQLIPNTSFESWTYDSSAMVDNLDGWYAPLNFGSPYPATVSRSTDANNGTYAARVEQKTYGSVNIPGILYTGALTTAKPGYLLGYYKAILATNDTFVISAAFLSSGNVGGGGAQKAVASQSTWTAFYIPLSYSSGFTPDSFTVGIYTSGPVGPIALVDDLRFSNTSFGNVFGVDVMTGIAGIASGRLSASSIVPNPATGNFAVNYELRTAAEVTLKVYDLAGKELKSITSFNAGPGKSSIRVDAADLTAGIYFCRISAGDAANTHKLVIGK